MKKVYRISLTTMRGKEIHSDPLDVSNLSEKEIPEVLDAAIGTVSSGGYLSIKVDGIQVNYLGHAIESIWWTEGS